MDTDIDAEKRKKQPEYELQVKVCEYLKEHYSDVIFLSDTIAQTRLTIPQQVRNKKIQKEDFHCPDLQIVEARRGYHSLFIELKPKTPYKRNGDLFKNKHLEDQRESIEDLQAKGFYACFQWDLDEIKKLIDWYLR